MLDEKVINHELAKQLRACRRAWNPTTIQAEPLGMIRGRQPDIVIAEPLCDPVILETELEPARTVEQDARNRLGAAIRGGTAHTAIAIRLPVGWRMLREDDSLAAAIRQGKLFWAVWTGETPDAGVRWPTAGWITGPLTDLAYTAYNYTTSPHRARKAADGLWNAVQSASEHLSQLSDAGYQQSLGDIAAELKQAYSMQTWSMVGLILINALVFHELLAGRDNLAPVPMLSQITDGHDGRLPKAAVLQAWQQILDVNYWPIFDLAKRVLGPVPDIVAEPLLGNLAKAMDDSGLRRLLPSHDVLSQTFQRLITDRKALAAFYTLPETAALLTGLAIRTDQAPNGQAWNDPEALKRIRILDPACGTGTLLSMAYRRLAWCHEAAGGDSAALHSHWMAHSLFGADVLPAAAHLTATILSGVQPTTHYGQSQIYIASYGDHDGEAVLGSLELLDRASHTDSRFGWFEERFENLSHHRVTAEGATPVSLARSIQDADVCIMNPPYTRNTNHEGARAGDPLPAFSAFGLSEETQRMMARRMAVLTHGTVAHGNGGLGTAFFAIANDHTREGGTIAMVLPLTFAVGSSWSAVRREMLRSCRDITVVAISGRQSRDVGFSADTGMAECLVVGRKALGETTELARITIVNLDQRPTHPLESTLMAERILNACASERVARLEDAPDCGGTPITLGDTALGYILSVPAAESMGWGVVRVADPSLAQAAYHLGRKHRAWLPGASSEEAPEVAMVPLSDVAQLGPYHLDINGGPPRPGRPPRGPFIIRPLSVGEVPTHPVLWSHTAAKERTLVLEADGAGYKHPKAPKEHFNRIASTATWLHFNLDWRFNSQALGAAWTDKCTLGGRAWPTIRLLTRDRAKDQALALLLWLNTTPGILVRWLWSNKQQIGRGIITLETLISLPVLDTRTLSEGQLLRCGTVLEVMRQEHFQPIHLLHQDPARARLDETFLRDILGWPAPWFGEHGTMTLLRQKLAAEPTIHGHKERDHI